MDQRQSNEDRLLSELAASVPLADPAVIAVVKELTAEISRLRTVEGPASGCSATVESLTDLLLSQAVELQDMRDRLQRVRALIELTSWAAATTDEATDDLAADPAIRASDILHAIAGPIAERPNQS
ncbi:MAG: hypothetical protein ACJ74U_13985 [Jatrophihabitantaceae bacterium]